MNNKENAAAEIMRKILKTKIPDENIEKFNEMFDVDVTKGATYMDALIRKGQIMSKTSPEWAEYLKSMNYEV